MFLLRPYLRRTSKVMNLWYSEKINILKTAGPPNIVWTSFVDSDKNFIFDASEQDWDLRSLRTRFVGESVLLRVFHTTVFNTHFCKTAGFKRFKYQTDPDQPSINLPHMGLVGWSLLDQSLTVWRWVMNWLIFELSNWISTPWILHACTCALLDFSWISMETHTKQNTGPTRLNKATRCAPAALGKHMKIPKSENPKFETSETPQSGKLENRKIGKIENRKIV